MPHYADGTQAKVGDQVVGKLYNTVGVRAGTIISITPGANSCNAMVGFIEAVPYHDDVKTSPPRMAVNSEMRIVNGENHGTTGDRFALFECADYCAVNELAKVG